MIHQYYTYIPLLCEAVRLTEGDVVELGGGLCSTPLLHTLVPFVPKERKLWTFESQQVFWANLRIQYEDERHQVLHVTDWRTQPVKVVGPTPSLVFVDHEGLTTDWATERRWSIEAFQNATVLVLHDYEETIEKPGMETWLREMFPVVVVDRHQFPSSAWLSKTTEPQWWTTRYKAA